MKIACIPQPRLGDAFYVALFLEWLRSRGYLGEAVVLCPPGVAWVYRIFGLEPRDVNSGLLGKGHGAGVSGELAFRKELKRLARDHVFLRVTNDVVEAIEDRIGGFAERRGDGLGNFFLRTGGRMRYRMSRWTGYKRGRTPNPLHFIHRLQCLAANEFEVVRQAELYAFFGRRSEEALSGIRASDLRGHFVIFPETSKTYKDLRPEQMRGLARGLAPFGDLVVVHSGKLDWDLPPDAREVRFADDREAGFRYVKNARLVVTADSFPAHFSPYFADETLIVYNQDRPRPSCEGWGVPVDGVAHFEAGACSALNEAYEAVPASPASDAMRATVEALSAERHLQQEAKT